MVATSVIVVLLLVSSFWSCGAEETRNSDCPCENPDWCEPIEKKYEKEVRMQTKHTSL